MKYGDLYPEGGGGFFDLKRRTHAWRVAGTEKDDRRYFNNWALRTPWQAFVAWLRCAP